MRQRLSIRHVLMCCSSTAVVLCSIVCIAWIVSVFRTDTIGWSGFDDRSAQTWRNWGVSSFNGELSLYLLQTGTGRMDESPHHLSGIAVPGMRPHAFHHGVPRREQWSLQRFVYRDVPEGGPDSRMPGFRLRFIGVPHWFVAMLCAIAGWPAGTRWLKRYLIARRPKPGHCRQCGYDLRASPDRCPECGTESASAIHPNGSKALSPLVAALLLALACGCSHKPTDAELAQVYRTGMTRDDALKALGQPMRVAVRPIDGWPREEKTAERIGAFASDFEQSHGAVVRTCQVYWTPRGFMNAGVWWDYLFFGSDDALLGFQRRFID